MTDAQIVDRIPNLSALVVGDICLDRWCRYDPSLSEPSRETTLPRTAVVSTEVTPGAGGTIANNLAALGCGRVSVLGAIGDDGYGFELSRALHERGISTDNLQRSHDLPTFTYTKLINAITGEEDLPRVDYIATSNLPLKVERQLLNALQAVVDAFNVIFVSDQAETSQGGIVTPAIRKLLAEIAPTHPEKVFVVDSRARVSKFRRLIVKPNEQEAEQACMEMLGRVDYPALREKLEAPILIVTRGPKGALLFSKHQAMDVPTVPAEHPVDICGAGDSFSAGFGLALALTHDPVRAAQFGNRVASVTIMKPGTGTASPQEILHGIKVNHQ